MVTFDTDRSEATNADAERGDSNAWVKVGGF